MSEVQHTIAMIGAGPASLYATEVLAKEGHQVVILNRDIKPGGLAEFGIYPTKEKMKSGLRKYFQRILARDNVRYFGNITVGVEADISLDEVRELGFDAVVVAVGAQGTKWLGLPGEEADAVFHAKDLVYHYNGLPPFSEREFPIGSKVAVVGLGNVCLDIVHWVVCEEKVESVTAIARRGPAERKFTAKEYKLVSGALDTESLDAELERVAPAMEAIGQDPQAERDKLFRYVDNPLEKQSQTTFEMRFLRSPVRINVDSQGQVTGIVCEKTRLLAPETDDDRVGLEYTDEFETIDCDTVVFAIGDAIEPSLGLPLSPRRDTFATVPEPWDEYPDRPRYMVYDPGQEEPMWDTFVVGWARKASDGLVGKARKDAATGCDEVLAYLDGEFPQNPDKDGPSTSDIIDKLEQLFSSRRLQVVRYDDVQRLTELEEQEAEKRQDTEFKFRSRDEMLKRLKG